MTFNIRVPDILRANWRVCDGRFTRIFFLNSLRVSLRKQMSIFFFLFLLVGHVLPIPSATDKDGEDDELVYWLEKTTKIPFELVSFGSNQIGRIHISHYTINLTKFLFTFQL